jgi:hypothetical protein
VQGYGDAGTLCGEDRQAGHLSSAHHGADVVLAEHPLDRDHVGAMGGDRSGEGIEEDAQPRAEQLRSRGAQHVDEHKVHRPSRRAIDHADAATGQTWVDTQHAHGHLVPSDIERSFDSV